MPPIKSHIDVSETLGEQSTLVFLVTFPDLGEEERYGITAETAESEYFDLENPWSVNSYFTENSEGRAWFAGECIGWLILPHESSYYGYCTNFQYGMVMSDTIEMVDDEVYFPDYGRLVFVVAGQCIQPQSTGGKIVTVFTDDGMVLMSETWNNVVDLLQEMNGTCIHELGHALGAGHANGTYFQGQEEECLGDFGLFTGGYFYEGYHRPYAVYEYWDYFSVMGSSGVGHLQEVVKQKFGWRDKKQIVEMRGSGSVVLDQRALPSAGIKFVKIPATLSLPAPELYMDPPGRKSYALEYSYPNTIFESIPSIHPMMPDNVVLRLYEEKVGGVDDGENNFWFGETVAIRKDQDGDQYAESLCLGIGEKFCDSNGITIMVTEKTGAGADAKAEVEISFECLGESGPLIFSESDYLYFEGREPFQEDREISITVGNTEGVVCGRNQYTLEAFPSEGWRVELGKTSLELDPLMAEEVPAVIKPPISFEQEYYQISLVATDTFNLLTAEFIIDIHIGHWTSPTPTSTPTPVPTWTPTPTPIWTPTLTPTPTPEECESVEMILNPEKMKLAKGETESETVAVFCDNGSPAEGIFVSASITKGKKKISVTPSNTLTDKNGQAVFAITGEKKGKAEVVFYTPEGLTESLIVKVK